MEDIDRRSVLAIGVAATAAVLPLSGSAIAQTYSATEGKEIGPGVRVVELGERESLIPAYKKVRMRDLVIQPGASTPETEMENDMVCHLTEGELTVIQSGKQFSAKIGDVWSCSKGLNTEGTKNEGDAVAIMRIIDLLTA